MMRHFFLLMFSVLSAACVVSTSQTPTSPAINPDTITRPAQIRTAEAPLVQGTPSQYTVTIRGWAIDDTTGERIEGAHFLVVTVLGTYKFDDTFEVSFPSDTVFQVLVTADGYADNATQIKPHYLHNAPLEMQIPMSWPTATPGQEG